MRAPRRIAGWGSPAQPAHAPSSSRPLAAVQAEEDPPGTTSLQDQWARNRPSGQQQHVKERIRETVSRSILADSERRGRASGSHGYS